MIDLQCIGSGFLFYCGRGVFNEWLILADADYNVYVESLVLIVVFDIILLLLHIHCVPFNILISPSP